MLTQVQMEETKKKKKSNSSAVKESPSESTTASEGDSSVEANTASEASSESTSESKETESKEATDKALPATVPAAETTTPSLAAATPAPATVQEPAASTEVVEKKPEEENSELMEINALLLCALAGGMFYLGTTYFGKDSLLFFTGIFIFLMIPPGSFVKGKNKMSRFTKEVALAFAVSFGIFIFLKAVIPPDFDQAKLIILVMTALGIKLILSPYYNFKKDE